MTELHNLRLRHSFFDKDDWREWGQRQRCSWFNLAAGAGSSAATGYQIARSLRFNSADTAYLTRSTFGTATLATRYTISFWVKRTKLGAIITLFEAGPASTTTEDFITFNANDTISVRWAGTIRLTTTRVFRDVGAWMHIVLAVDLSLGTSSAAKLYINGDEETTFSTDTRSSITSTNQKWNTNTDHWIGRNAPAAAGYGDYYLSDFNFIDGQQLTSSSFGQTDVTTGAWNPKAYTGTYGTNGFKLDFSDNSNTTAATLGADRSGNGNNWTPNNFSVTTGVGNDSLTDTPTNYGTDTGAGGEVRGNYCTLNPLTTGQGSIVRSNGNLDVTDAANEDAHVFGTVAVNLSTDSQGYYFEAIINALGANHYIGVGQTRHYTGSNTAAGNWLLAVGSGSNGVTYGNGVTGSDLGAISATNVVMVAFKGTNIWFGVNGTWFASGDPAAGTNAAWTNVSGVVSPIWANGGLSSPAASFNFGQRQFAHTAPSGFKALCTQNLPTPTIVKPSNYFDVNTRAGTGAAFSVTGKGFQPDLVWTKGRSGATDHALYDSVRGVQADLASNLTTAETTQAQGVTAFNSDGYSGGTLAKLNTSAATYVDWLWKEGVAPGLDIVTYTGTGAATTVSHNLGVAPDLVIAKCRSTAGSNWPVYHRGGGASPVLFLNLTNAGAAASNYYSSAPTSSVVNIGTDGDINGAARTYVMYVFAGVSGFSRFGSYTGNGATDGPFVWCGFRPRWILIKDVTGANAWRVFDAARDTFNLSVRYLVPNAADAENGASNTTDIDILSNGFKIRGTAGTINTSSSTYIFAAFAERPFKYARAR